MDSPVKNICVKLKAHKAFLHFAEVYILYRNCGFIHYFVRRSYVKYINRLIQYLLQSYYTKYQHCLVDKIINHYDDIFKMRNAFWKGQCGQYQYGDAYMEGILD